MRVNTVRRELPGEETIVILQTTEYDDPLGRGVWTLCVWRVEGGDWVERQLGSAVIPGSI
jgi:hypothetical protein